MRTSARALVAVSAALLAGGLAACGDDSDGSADAGADGIEASDATDGGPEGDETTTTTAPPTPEELAKAAYQESWDATFRALNPPQQLPEIAETHTGEALSETVNLIAEKQRLGHRVEGSMQTNPVLVSASETEVQFDDCAVESSIEYDAAGNSVDSADDAPFNYRVTLVNEDDAWKVSDFERRAEPCDPA